MNWDGPFRGAYYKGRNAALSGKKKSNCPYEEKRTHNDRLTYSRAFRKAWFDGFDEGMELNRINLFYPPELFKEQINEPINNHNKSEVK